MSTVTSDSLVKAALGGQTGLTELRGAGGELLGYFLPPMPMDELRLYLKVITAYDSGEIERRKTEELGQGKTTQEVLDHLKTVERPPCGSL